jgi:hypothetical protein
MTQVWERPWVDELTDAQLLAKGNPNHVDRNGNLPLQGSVLMHCGANISRAPPWSQRYLTVSAFSFSPER